MIRTLFVLLLLSTLIACGGDAEKTPNAATPAADAPATSPPAADATAAKTDGFDPCAALNLVEVARVFEAGSDAVVQTEGDAHRFGDGRARDCITTVTKDGVETTVTLYALEKSDNTAADAWASRVASVIADGEKVGNQTYAYEAASLGGVDGAISEAGGGRYVSIRMMLWQENEKLLHRLTLATTTEDGSEPPVPTDEHFAQLIEAIGS